MLNCYLATQLLSQRQDRSLKFNEKTQLTFHLGMCSNCRNFAKQMSLLSSLSKQYRDRENSIEHDEHN